MYLKAILALAQTIFIPGYIFFNWLKIKTNPIRKLIFIFSLSLILNYIFVFLLVITKFYNLYTLYSLIIIEILIIIFFIKKTENERFKLSYILNFWEKSTKPEKLAINLGLIATLWVFLILLKNTFFFNNFVRWDAIVSWNRWALDWYSNILPQGTMHYPQLIPANWSISYVILGAPIQFIPKLIMPLFTLFMLFLFWDLGTTRKNFGYIWAIPAIILFIKHAMGKIIESGLVDLPVAFMTITSLSCILFAQKINDKKTIKKYLFLGSIISAGALVTKQAGIIIVLTYPILVFTLIKQLKFKTKIKIILIHLLNILLIAVPFYIYKQIEILQKIDNSEISTVTNGIYKGSNLIQRFIYSIKIFLTYNLVFLGNHAVIKNKLLHIITGSFLGIIYSIFIWFSLKNKTFKIIFFTILLPYSIFWALFLCYDFRNYAIAVPLYGLALGLGINYLIKKLNWKTIKYIFLIILTITILFIDSKTKKSDLLNQQNKKILKIGKYKLNKKLQKYNSKNHKINRIISDYTHIKNIIPKASFFYQKFNIVYCGYQGKKQTEKELYSKYKNNLKNNFDYILYPIQNISEKIKAHINKNIKSKIFKKIFKKNGYCLLKINNEYK